MAARYFDLDGKRFEAWLAERGFARDDSRDEIVYRKRSEANQNLLIKVFTSIGTGEAVGRECGADAIRVCAIFSNGQKEFGVCKTTRVHRTTSQESIQERVAERLSVAETICSEWTEKERASDSYVGAVGEKVRLTLKVVKRGEYGGRFMFIMTDEKLRKCVYWSNLDVLKAGETYEMSAVVKTHKVFNGVKQSELEGCRGKMVVGTVIAQK